MEDDGKFVTPVSEDNPFQQPSYRQFKSESLVIEHTNILIDSC